MEKSTLNVATFLLFYVMKISGAIQGYTEELQIRGVAQTNPDRPNREKTVDIGKILT
jgi:hypothetical protein